MTGAIATTHKFLQWTAENGWPVSLRMLCSMKWAYTKTSETAMPSTVVFLRIAARAMENASTSLRFDRGGRIMSLPHNTWYHLNPSISKRYEQLRKLGITFRTPSKVGQHETNKKAEFRQTAQISVSPAKTRLRFSALATRSICHALTNTQVLCLILSGYLAKWLWLSKQMESHFRVGEFPTHFSLFHWGLGCSLGVRILIHGQKGTEDLSTLCCKLPETGVSTPCPPKLTTWVCHVFWRGSPFFWRVNGSLIFPDPWHSKAEAALGTKLA